jgi:tetratricopeptide (TPR) repeat protein
MAEAFGRWGIAARVHAAPVALAAVVAGCAQVPVPAEAPAEAAPPIRILEEPGSGVQAAAVARQQELAQNARKSGDFPAAIAHTEVLALLEPGNPAHPQALAALRELAQRDLREELAAAAAARRAGELAKARDHGLRALLLDPDNAQAKQGLREVDAQVMARAQAERAARARTAGDVIGNVKARIAAESIDLEQGLELLRAGDTTSGVRELRAWADANPRDAAGRERAGTAIAEKARELEGSGARENALSLYEQAARISGLAKPPWAGRAQALRKALSEEAYALGVKAMRTDLAAAIRQFETSVRLDPDNANAQRKLREARTAQARLSKIAPAK